jgi:hypothetical protein
MSSDGGDTDKPEDEDMDEVELEVDEEIDKDQKASDEQEIQELADEVDADIRFFVRESDLALEQSAMLKVCG